VIRLTQLAVSKRSVTVLITLAMLLGGVFAWASLKQELLPNIAFPYVVVITPVPGASAQDVAVAVTEPVERSIGSLPALWPRSTTGQTSKGPRRRSMRTSRPLV
jgi:multidrug efflux pump subunit AcrB